MKANKKRTERLGGKLRMLRQDHLCPFMKKTCIGCSIYRGRHSGIWTDEAPLHALSRRAKKGESDWIASLNAFFRDASIMQGEEPDYEKK